MKLLRRGFAVVGGLLLLLLAVGIVLPGEWSVERSARVEVPRDSMYALLTRPASWSAWMPWPETGARFEGPERGAGAAFSWDDPTYGAGRLTVVGAEAPDSIRYTVSVEEGAFRVRGRIRLDADAGSTVVHWREAGDFGWNPLLGYAALTVEERQGRALARTLERLAEHVEGRSRP